MQNKWELVVLQRNDGFFQKMFHVLKIGVRQILKLLGKSKSGLMIMGSFINYIF